MHIIIASRKADLHHLSYLQLANIHESLIQHPLLKAQQYHTVKRRMSDDSSAVHCASFVLICTGRQGVDTVIRDVTDLC